MSTSIVNGSSRASIAALSPAQVTNRRRADDGVDTRGAVRVQSVSGTMPKGEQK